MEVAIIFDPVFDGDAGEAVWVRDTPENRKWFEAQRNLDPDSALFFADDYPDIDSAISHAIWNAQEHYPNWHQINVIGAGLTADMAAELQRDGEISSTPTGFQLRRR